MTLSTTTRRKVRNYRHNDKLYEINIGDYLLWAVGYKMISSITYCANPNGDKDDYLLDTMRDYSEERVWDEPVKNHIQLKYNKDMAPPPRSHPKIYKKISSWSDKRSRS